MNALETFVGCLERGDTLTLKNLPESFIYDCQNVLRKTAEAGGRNDKRISSVRHFFVEGQYIREITMHTGAMLTSRKHLTEHPFIVSKGVVSVFIPGVGLQVIQAPYCGITKPGTKRLLFINRETVWTTIHLNPKELRDPDKIIREITEEEELEFEGLLQ